MHSSCRPGGQRRVGFASDVTHQCTFVFAARAVCHFSLGWMSTTSRRRRARGYSCFACHRAANKNSEHATLQQEDGECDA